MECFWGEEIDDWLSAKLLFRRVYYVAVLHGVVADAVVIVQTRACGRVGQFWRVVVGALVEAFHVGALYRRDEGVAGDHEPVLFLALDDVDGEFVFGGGERERAGLRGEESAIREGVGRERSVFRQQSCPVVEVGGREVDVHVGTVGGKESGNGRFGRFYFQLDALPKRTLDCDGDFAGGNVRLRRGGCYWVRYTRRRGALDKHNRVQVGKDLAPAFGRDVDVLALARLELVRLQRHFFARNASKMACEHVQRVLSTTVSLGRVTSSQKRRTS